MAACFIIRKKNHWTFEYK